MATKDITIDVFDKKSLSSGVKKVARYRDNLPKKIEKVVRLLAQEGVKTATVQESSGRFASYILFYQDTFPTQTGCKAIVYGQNIAEVWGDGVGAGQINPILMEEYGSGSAGLSHQVIDGIEVGQGSYPGQTHALDPNGWYYLSTTDGKWHHSYGVTPTAPMQKAYDVMVTKVDSIIKQVFK